MTPNPQKTALEGPQSAEIHTPSQRSVAEGDHPLGSSTNSSTRSLTTITNSPSPLAARSAAVLRYALQAKARELLPDHRVGWCMRRFRHDRVKVGIVHAPKRGAAYFDGLMRCSRVWVCPVCAAKISETRRTELNDLLLASRVVVPNGLYGQPHYYDAWHLTMITFTIQHKPDESAADVLARLDAAWARFGAGKWIQNYRARFNIEGTLRALEMTHGSQGWHPHLHVLQFHRGRLREAMGGPPEFAPSQAEMIMVVRSRWSDCALKIGGYADTLRGAVLSNKAVKNYPIKADAERELKRWGMTSEVTKQPVKKGRDGNRSLTDLLIDAAKGDELAGHLWREGVAALEGHKQLEPSKGLWQKLGRKPKTDEEAAEDEIDAADRVLAELTWAQWRIVLATDRRGEVLDIAATGDTDALWRLLESLGVHRDDL